MNDAVRRWGVPIDDDVRQADVGSGTAPVATTPPQVELLTLWFDSRGRSSADLVVWWGGTSVRVPVELQPDANRGNGGGR